jgi:transcriptional antiterminator NusG
MADKGASIPNDSLAWFALYVRTRRECTVQACLAEKGYETFLPMMVETRVYGRKKRKAEVPCFPSYLFCRLNPHDRLFVMTTPDVYSIVRRGASPEAIPDSELNALKVMINSHAPIERHPHLTAGDPVFIASGPLAGIEGVLLRVGNSQRVAVSISLLRRSVSAEVDCDDVVPANKCALPSYHPGVAGAVHAGFAAEL